MVEPRPAAPGSLDNTHLATGYSDGSVVVFDLMTGEPLKFAGAVVLCPSVLGLSGLVLILFI